MSYYDRNGRPIDLLRFAELTADDSYRIIGVDTIDGQRVSTVWLGINHNFGRGPLTIFETMIFDGEHDLECRPYSSEGKALRGHREAVNNLHRGRAPW